MGMFDDVKCDAPLPDDRVPPGSWFQSKSLYCNMDRFTITATGRLIHHPVRHEWEGEREIRPGVSIPACRHIPLPDVDTQYHGDIKFYAQAADGSWADYVARFTNGSLEWILPYDALSELQKTWFDLKW